MEGYRRRGAETGLWQTDSYDQCRNVWKRDPCGNQLCRGQKALISLQGYFFSRAIPEIKYKTLRNRKVKRVAA